MKMSAKRLLKMVLLLATCMSIVNVFLFGQSYIFSVFHKPTPSIQDELGTQDRGTPNANDGLAIPLYARSSPNENKARLSTIERTCEMKNTSQIKEFDSKILDNIGGRLLVEQKHSIIYCGLEKVASTFWKRVLTVMKHTEKYSSPFKMDYSQIDLTPFKKMRQKLSATELKGFFERAFSFMFVRDPYSRLYSGYENKIYHANIGFWRGIGAKVVKLVRKNPTPQSLKYGYDVTFSEFVQYILTLWENGKAMDAHFSPMYIKCDPCIMPYNFLGKLETFHEDTHYLINLWQEKFQDFNINFDNFEKETAMDTGKGRIKFSFQAWKFIRNKTDYPLYNLLLRTWSDLQIRGLLSKGIPFPFTPSETVNITATDVVNALDKALDIPVNKTEVRLQRSESLAQAYRTIPLETMERLRKFVLTDCQLFGYDDRPQLLFDRSCVDMNEHVYMKGI